MRNRAKCKLCSNIIESMHDYDLQVCECGEIAVDRGLAMKCYARDFKNFLRVADDDRVFEPKIVEKDEQEMPLHTSFSEIRQNLVEVVGALTQMIESIHALPDDAMSKPITHYDFVTLLEVLREAFADYRVSQQDQ